MSCTNANNGTTGIDRRMRLSRRGLLKGSLALVAGSLLSRAAGALLAAATWQVSPKRIYIAPDDHTDYLWTAGEATYRQAFLDMLDHYLDRADATANQPSDYQSRWNCDGSFWVWTYEKNKSASDLARLIQRIRDGHITVPLNPLIQCLGGAPAEAVLRGMYYAGRIERRYGLRFNLAHSMENTTLPYGLGALWAGAGARYSWNGVCGCASRLEYSSLSSRDREIYWWVGPDGSRLLMKWHSLVGNPGIGSYAEARDPSGAVDYVDTNSSFQARYHYNVIGVFGKGWDDLQTTTDEFETVAKNKTNTGRRVIVSNEQDFFQDFEATYGPSLPSLSCSFGNEWDLLCASMAEVSARVKRAVEKLRSAEALATLVSLHNAGFMIGREPARDLAFMDLGLYWEHDWTADNPSLREARRAWQIRLAGEIEGYVNTLHTDAANALAGMIQKSGSNTRFYAFNPLSWARTDIADLRYPTSTVHVVDLTTGAEVPSQFVTLDGQSYLRILARNVPAVGYKVFEIRPGPGSETFPPAASADAATGVIENDACKVTVAGRGAITSLIDKTQSNREFAKASDDGRVINDLGPGTGALQVENVGPVSATMLATVTASSPLKHTSRITLFRDSNRVEIRNDINQNFSDTFTWSFAFDLDSPDVWHEEVGAVIRAKLTTDDGHYSPRNARHDWLTLNHFADVSGGGVGATLSNADCFFMQLGNSSVDTLDVAKPQISALVGGQVDGPALGFANQGGDAHFLQRFALQTHAAYDPVAAMRFALEHQNPLVTAVITGGSDYPEESYSLLSISNPHVLLWALKPAEDGFPQRVIVRLWNLADRISDFALSLSSGPIWSARRTTHIETPLDDATVMNGALAASLAAHQISTFSIKAVASSEHYIYLPLILKE